MIETIGTLEDLLGYLNATSIQQAQDKFRNDYPYPGWLTIFGEAGQGAGSIRVTVLSDSPDPRTEHPDFRLTGFQIGGKHATRPRTDMAKKFGLPAAAKEISEWIDNMDANLI